MATLFKGILALDIDGTLTSEAHSIPVRVAKSLEAHAQTGWILFFITGRTFKWANPLLENLKAPYYLAVQNGALLLKMPEKEPILKNYLDMNLLKKMDKFHPEGTIFSGFEQDDVVYYRRGHFTSEELKYLDYRRSLLKETWIDCKDFSMLPFTTFASLKWIGKKEELMPISEFLESSCSLHAPLIKDPVQDGYYVVQATHAKATKGDALADGLKLLPHPLPVIAAGDDTNDIPMLKLADIKVVMQGASDELIGMADVIAPPVTEEGIIEGLERAMDDIFRGKFCS